MKVFEVLFAVSNYCFRLASAVEADPSQLPILRDRHTLDCKFALKLNLKQECTLPVPSHSHFLTSTVLCQPKGDQSVHWSFGTPPSAPSCQHSLQAGVLLIENDQDGTDHRLRRKDAYPGTHR